MVCLQETPLPAVPAGALARLVAYLILPPGVPQLPAMGVSVCVSVTAPHRSRSEERRVGEEARPWMARAAAKASGRVRLGAAASAGPRGAVLQEASVRCRGTYA